MATLGDFELDQIYTGDARELAKGIPDGSVDLIFTDPPYLAEYLPLYQWLSKLSFRLLKPGSYLFAYGAGEHMERIFDLMRGHGMKYFWMEPLLHLGGYPRMWHKHLMSGYKPIFVYTKGDPNIKPWRATVHSDEQDKRWHTWGQGMGTAVKIIDLLTKPSSVVLEPFCGGGSVLAACKILRRHYLAFEIDPKTADIARRRVAETQPPLFVLEHQQSEMFGGAQ